MKRCFLTLAGLVSFFATTGCCCDGCNWCNPCCSPCGSACNSPCGSTYAAPAGAYYAPYGGTATAAAVPVESLPTY